MAETKKINKIRSELAEGIGLSKCRKCGCMRDALENLRGSFSVKIGDFFGLLAEIDCWSNQMEPVRYACLGCKHCFPAVATNIFRQAFPDLKAQPSDYAFESNGHGWPVVAGEYYAFCEGKNCPVAVSTLGSVELAMRLADNRPSELCIVGKTETENIGIDKIIKNTVTNPTIRYLLVAGNDPKGHYSGKTLLSLWTNGVDENMRVIDSPGKHPVLQNVAHQEVESFRKQVEIVDMIGCEDEKQIIKKIKELSSQKTCSCCGCEQSVKLTKSVKVSKSDVIRAKDPQKIEMDKAGYFVIFPKSQSIIVEHYTYDNLLGHIIEGMDARSLYWTIIEHGWVTQLSHAAYLGKELMKAELSIKMGFRYTQDGA